jgi:uncharacterized protein (DUF305 family)
LQEAAMPPKGGSPADVAMMSGMQKMRQDMENAPMIGDADHDFVAMMVPHHQGAVDMAQVELQYGKDPGMRAPSRSSAARCSADSKSPVRPGFRNACFVYISPSQQA